MQRSINLEPWNEASLGVLARGSRVGEKCGWSCSQRRGDCERRKSTLALLKETADDSSTCLQLRSLSQRPPRLLTRCFHGERDLLFSGSPARSSTKPVRSGGKRQQRLYWLPLAAGQRLYSPSPALSILQWGPCCVCQSDGHKYGVYRNVARAPLSSEPSPSRTPFRKHEFVATVMPTLRVYCTPVPSYLHPSSEAGVLIRRRHSPSYISRHRHLRVHEAPLLLLALHQPRGVAGTCIWKF